MKLVLGFLSLMWASQLLADSRHACTDQALPLTSEEDLVLALQCWYPDSRILRLVNREQDLYLVRLLHENGIEDVLFHLSTGMPVIIEE